ncbi:hypothetical protein BLSTO_06619 [Blastocystis sp. subtype 1]
MVELRILYVIPYESSRKRMSVIVQMPNGRLLVFAKVARTASCWSCTTPTAMTSGGGRRSPARWASGQRRRSARWCSGTRS